MSAVGRPRSFPHIGLDQTSLRETRPTSSRRRPVADEPSLWSYRVRMFDVSDRSYLPLKVLYSCANSAGRSLLVWRTLQSPKSSGCVSRKGDYAESVVSISSIALYGTPCDMECPVLCPNVTQRFAEANWLREKQTKIWQGAVSKIRIPERYRKCMALQKGTGRCWNCGENPAAFCPKLESERLLPNICWWYDIVADI